ncbi:DUF3050 domain-containing protein [Piscirickettsia litoralis]|uniref:DUF3050 domain-containing protein n=1 Tax=Piscirickettsia litoralis TaxID=1891921 RepID=UPI000980CB85|nr:DUF3050 domain-containing protein [Piscirickettsia litoralis]
MKSGYCLEQAMQKPSVPISARLFVNSTFSFFKLSAHELAAVFTFSREGITSGMFSSILNHVASSNEQSIKAHEGLQELSFYLKRHIELDGNEHFPKAMQMLTNLAGNDDQKWFEIEHVAKKSLNERIKFLSGIYRQLKSCSYSLAS